jgi:uncharacterized CHY-type Zn-finger protein
MNKTEKPNAIICGRCHAPNTYHKTRPAQCGFCQAPLSQIGMTVCGDNSRLGSYETIPGAPTGADDIELPTVDSVPVNKQHAKIRCLHCDVDIEYPAETKAPEACPFCKMLFKPIALDSDDDSVAVQQEIATLRIVRDTEGNVVGSFAFDAEQLSTHDLRGVVAELQVINQLLTSTIISLEGMGTDGSTKTKD